MAETERPECVRLWREYIELILFRGSIFVSRQTYPRRPGHVKLNIMATFIIFIFVSSHRYGPLSHF